MKLGKEQGLWVGRFQAMASPCEVLIDGGNRAGATRVLHAVQAEARRIERKFSRYRDDNLVHRLHHNPGLRVELDVESARLIDYGVTAWELSEGRFDLSSGVLREVWRFDGSDQVPDPNSVQQVLRRVGWQKVEWNNPSLTLPVGMQIDLGGVGKEYAVDRCMAKAVALIDRPVLVNFGGDLRASAPRHGAEPWKVGMENANDASIALSQGALATSGDARRFLLHDGVRYSHILDARTGWPVPDAPRSVTVAADDCITAGLYATLASLQGAQAEKFLAQLDVVHTLQR